MKSLLVLLSLCATCAFAKDPVYVGMLEFPDFQKLDAEKRALYLHGLQSIASGLNQIHQKKVGYPKGRRPANVDRLCEYAGLLMQKTVDGDCPKPARGSCPEGMVQCEPFLFGQGICAKEGPGATLQCRENARPVSELLKLIEKDPGGWAKTEADLGAYCDGNSEAESCSYIRGRFWEINKIVGMETPPPVDVVDAGNASRPISAWGDFNERMKMTGAGSGAADAQIAALNAMAAKQRAEAEERSREDARRKEAENSKRCQTAALTTTVRCAESEGAESVMSVAEVNRIFCEKQGVAEPELDMLRERLKRMEGCLRSTISKTKGLQKTKAEAALSSLKGTVGKNFENCFKDLQAGKFVEASKLGTLRKSGSQLTFSPDDRKASSVRTDEEFLSPALGTQGIQICQLRLDGFTPEKPLLDTKKSGAGPRGRR